MNREMSFFGGMVVLGVWSWPYWEPSFFQLKIALICCCSLSLCIAKIRGSVWFFWLLAFLFGNMFCARLPTPTAPVEGSVVGRVLVSSGRQALVESEVGRIQMLFSTPAPPVGTELVARIKDASGASVLPGERNVDRDVSRARAVLRRVKIWQALYTPKREIPAYETTSFAHAKHGGLMWSLATGERTFIASHTKHLLKQTGTSHLLAISGMHIAIVAGMTFVLVRYLFCFLLFRGFFQLASWLSTGCALAICWLYGSRVGWPPSAQRATIMVSIGLLALQFGRKPDPWLLLSVAATIVLYWEPAQFNQLGFLMSFSAVAGILLVSPRIVRLFPPDFSPFLKKCLVGMGVTMGATFGTLPIVAWQFQELSPSSPFANLIALPLLAMVAVPCSLFAAFLPDVFALIALVFGDVAISLGLWLLELFVVPFWHPAVGSLGAVALYLLFFLHRHEWLALSLLSLIIFRFRGDPTSFEVQFLSIGQGDAALVEWPDGRKWLIDGGPKSTKLLKFLRRKGIGYLDAIFLSHPHPDHIGGILPIIQEIEVGKIWTVRPPKKSEELYQTLWQEIERQDIVVAFPDESPGDGGTILHPLNGWTGPKASRVNNESLVLEIEYGEHRFLFTGDIEKAAELELLPKLRPVDVVKVAHHGSKTSSTKPFVEILQPTFSIFSCGVGNRFHHPHPQTLWRWRNSKILRTDTLGTIQMRSNGEGEIEMITWKDAKSVWWTY